MTDQILTDEQRAANIEQSLAANQANASTGIFGVSGVGKSNLADTGAEWAWEEFGGVTLCYAADLGGFGNKRLNLIQQGIVRVYDPSNHVDPFATMELISLGAFPETLIDPERGYAAPDVKLILPRRIVHVVYCPQGHVAARLNSAMELNSFNQPCPECGVPVTAQTAQKTEKVIVRHPMFKNVVLRIYDSFTGLSDAGLADLQDQSAKGLLPKTGGGGSLLGAADALRSGEFVFGSSSEGQYGFVQNRVYGWLKNIRTIPDQKVPAILTFLVELSKESKRGAGDLHYGPKIAGQAATSALPAKLGNLLHATREAFNANDPMSPLVHRLYLRNHISANDPAKIPYVAKHRGTPLGMPDYLEDAPDDKGVIVPWSGFSLKVFFRLLDQQLKKLEKYPNAPGMWCGEAAGTADEVMGTVNAPSAAGQMIVSAPGRRFRTAPAVSAPAMTPSGPAGRLEPTTAQPSQTAVAPSVTAAQGPVTQVSVTQPGTAPPAPPIPAATAAAPAPTAQVTTPPPAPAATGVATRRRFAARPPTT